ncbi:MAG: NAD(+) diphosphatase [Magnetovibrio sp.]|nr:NAD(+) diphosphatase [Magnetovibrio sp.]|tara:strand:- start:2488 stop:3471 length:984 start_codon:yes stop_codon:yes gene_type:complete
MYNRALTSLTYTDVPLDRAGLKRRDKAWLGQSLSDANVKFVACWRNRSHILKEGDGLRALLLKRADAPKLIQSALSVVFLGIDETHAPVFSADISHFEEFDAITLAGGEGQFIDIRQLGWIIPRTDAALLAYARGLAYWHRSHRHCGYCGSSTEISDGGHMRLCTNQDCARTSFPRTDPAVIMLVEHPGDTTCPPSCLLGRSTRWDFPLYSTLAGFVEPGETLEQAVTREVMEEANIDVTDVRYMASQPWPFPSSLMLGFRATATSTEITMDPKELQDVRWFTINEVRRFSEWNDSSKDEPRLPRPDSIARWLIQSWFNDRDDSSTR